MARNNLLTVRKRTNGWIYDELAAKGYEKKRSSVPVN